MRDFLPTHLQPLFVLILHSAMVFAGQSASAREWSWSTLSENEDFILVLVYPDSVEKQLQSINDCWREDDAERMAMLAEMRRLEANYSVSGVYRNDGSQTPIWTTNGFVWSGHLSPDGNRIVSFHNHHCFTMIVQDVSGIRETYDMQIQGLFSRLCYQASGNYIPYAEDWFLSNDPSWDYLTIVWENGAQATVRLDDLSVVKSNVNRYAIRAMTSTPQGIAILLTLFMLCVFLIWGTLNLVWKVRRKQTSYSNSIVAS